MTAKIKSDKSGSQVVKTVRSCQSNADMKIAFSSADTRKTQTATRSEMNTRKTASVKSCNPCQSVMLTGGKRYPAYKDSGVEWLGEIPEGWYFKRFKYLGMIYSGLSNKIGEDFSKEYQIGSRPYVSFINICNGYVVSDYQNQYVRITKHETQNIVKHNDLLFLMSSETLDDIGKCSIFRSNEENVYLNSFCKGFRITYEKMFPQFVNYLLNSFSYRKYFKLFGRGFIRINIKQEYINNIEVLLPPLSEQTAIASFLDSRVAKIDTAIAQKEKLIALLKERKQIIIQNAVTKGLNPDVKMKDSGVEWIGEIPEHWEVVKNRTLFVERKEYGREDLPILSVSIHSAVSSEEISEDENIRGKIRIQDKSSYKLVDVDDIVFNMMRAWQGAIGAVKTQGMVSPAYIVAQPQEHIIASFFELMYRTDTFIQQMNRKSKGITDFRKRLYWDEFKQLITLLPPIVEQNDIVQYIHTQSSKIDHAISFQQKQIDKLKEFKTTLIDSAVTGKIKVF